MISMSKSIAVLLLLFASASASLGEKAALSGFIVVERGWARATPPGASVGGGFLVIDNQSGRDDRLVRVESPLAEKVELHETLLADGVAQMRPLADGLAVRNDERVTLAPGSLHLMFSGLKQPLREGGTLPIRLLFEEAGPLETELVILPLGSSGPSEGEPEGR